MRYVLQAVCWCLLAGWPAFLDKSASAATVQGRVVARCGSTGLKSREAVLASTPASHEASEILARRSTSMRAGRRSCLAACLRARASPSGVYMLRSGTHTSPRWRATPTNAGDGKAFFLNSRPTTGHRATNRHPARRQKPIDSASVTSLPGEDGTGDYKSPTARRRRNQARAAS
jgi:hypothetical protein